MKTEKLSLSQDEKKTLLLIARHALEKHIKGEKTESISPARFSDDLHKPCGAFVSLYRKGKLRGCVGRFIASAPLFQTVAEMAVAAAVNDTRFKPVKAIELKDIKIELSVLSPLKRIKGPEEVKLGTHGIYIKKGFRTGTYLPQVAIGEDWSVVDFIEHCAQYKAGLDPGEWRQAELYTYTALVINENDVA